jgi:two-component system OmpR family sensor kinase
VTDGHPGVRSPGPRPWWGPRLTADVLATAGASAVTLVALNSAAVQLALPAGPTNQVLTLAAAAAGSGSAILAVVASRLLGDPRPAWIASALVLYCAIVLPWTTMATTSLDDSQRASRLVAYLTALLLLVLSIRPPRRLGTWGGWVLMLVGGIAAVVVLVLPVSGFARWLVGGPVLTVSVLVGWTAAAVAYVLDGHRRRSTPRLRLGLGLVVLAGAQLYRVAVAVPAATADLAFAGLRLLGLLVVLAALAQLVQRTLTTLHAEQWQQQEELVTAALHMERAGDLAAERDHELRNGLAGLAGITHLLSTDTEGEDHAQLKHAVLAELSRLHALLDAGDLGTPAATGPDAPGYLVEPVLSGLVALRLGSGAHLEQDVEPGLRAAGDPAVLAQVVTNLLANCDRHAPGAPIGVEARRRDGHVVIRIRDAGPGLRAGTEESVFDRGAHDPAAGGTGLGLDISRRLVRLQGGTLTLHTVEEPRGCLATVAVPAAPVPSDDRAAATPGT